MPYLKINDRVSARAKIINSGQLNFRITELITQYIKENGLCYAKINDIIGALECAKAEFYRRVVGPYENQKIIENGDVYGNEAKKYDWFEGKVDDTYIEDIVKIRNR